MDSNVHDKDTCHRNDPVKASMDIQLKTNDLDRKIEAVEQEQETVMTALDVGGSHRGMWTPGNLVSALQDLRKKESQLREEKLLLMRIGLDNGYPFQCAKRTDEGVCSAPECARGADEGASSSESTGSDTSSQADTNSNCTDIPATHIVFVKATSGKLMPFDVSPTNTVLDLKEKLQDQEGIPPKQQRFIFGGGMLQDERTLAESGVGVESTIHLVTSLRGGKPVILLYPPTQLIASVRLTLGPHWTFSTLYPKTSCVTVKQSQDSLGTGDKSCEWKVHASPDGTLREFETKQEYPYLFWEADSEGGQVAQSFYLKDTRSFCIVGDHAGTFLDEALTRLGLNARERCDMITYWLLQLEAYQFNVIYFIDAQRYAQAAKLTIVPNPDVVIRVFMAFRGVETYDATLDTAELEGLNAPARDGFVAVEWGGMNLNGPV